MKLILLLLAVALFGLSICPNAQAFTHPGMSPTVADLDAVKAKIQADEAPWSTGYSYLAGDWHPSLSYSMQGPFTTVSHNPNQNLTQWRNDMTAAYNQARIWRFTGNEAHAHKGRDILVNLADAQTAFGGMEANLNLGDHGFRLRRCGIHPARHLGGLDANRHGQGQGSLQQRLSSVFEHGHPDDRAGLEVVFLNFQILQIM